MGYLLLDFWRGVLLLTSAHGTVCGGLISGLHLFNFLSHRPLYVCAVEVKETRKAAAAVIVENFMVGRLVVGVRKEVLIREVGKS